MVVDRLLRPDPADDPDGRLTEDGRLVGHAVRRLVLGDLSGLFDGPSTVKFDPSLPMVSLDLSRVTENSTLISVLMTCSSAWMEAALLDPNGGRRWVIYDEAWRLMSHPALLRRMDAHWRLARHYRLTNLLVVHKLTDLENVGNLGSANRALANTSWRTPRPGSCTGRRPISLVPLQPRSASPAPNSASCPASAPGRASDASRTAPSSCCTSSTPQSWPPSTPPPA
ncbi:hypothetical protein HDA33_000461 [Micrococcus endophyticus]|uniref:ATP-binding protein n=1 Tax=Micrococcus endophyticus TaxID=455343 RepID=A0A7W9JHD8_9MICC|nr:hypothetical protein [Micrococcus endophyticus]